MSETVARQRPSVDLDAFERRSRQMQGNGHEDDPLAELARIVGDDYDPLDEMFAQQSAVPAHHDLRASFAPDARQEPSLGGAAPRFADFAAIEAGLRGAPTQPLHPQVAPGHDTQPDYAEPDYAFPPEHDAGAMSDMADWEQPRQPARAPARQKPVYGIAAAIVLAVTGIGVAFAYKGTGSSPREIRTIMAAAGPTKVQPPVDVKADAADQNDAAVGQGQAPTKLVSREEQPVDLQQAVQDNEERDAASRGTDASSVPVPPSPGGTMSPDYSAMGGHAPDPAGTASPTYSDQGFGVGMPLPKKVRSVSVKPDGTIVPGAQGDTAETAPAVKQDDRIGALAQESTPARLEADAALEGDEVDVARGRRAAAGRCRQRRRAGYETGEARAQGQAGPGRQGRGRHRPGQRVRRCRRRRQARGQRRLGRAARRAGLRVRRPLGHHEADQEVQRCPARAPPRLPPCRQQRPHGLPRPRLEPDEGGRDEPLRQAQGRRRQLLRRQELELADGAFMPRAFVCGCRGTTLADDERAFLEDADPIGVILFGRNIENPAQVSALTDEIRDCARA